METNLVEHYLGELITHDGQDSEDYNHAFNVTDKKYHKRVDENGLEDNPTKPRTHRQPSSADQDPVQNECSSPRRRRDR